MKTFGTLLVIAAAALVIGCNSAVNEDINVPAGATEASSGMTINGSIHVGDGAKTTEASFRTVNGRIRIGEGAQVSDCATVNGRVELGANSEAGTVQTVNGSIHASSNARINGEIKLVNGDVRLDDGAEVSGNITTINGEIELRRTEIGGDVSNVNGDMLITDGSLVRGRVIVREDKGNLAGERPRIVIGPDTRIVGGLKFERPVELYLHETAAVGEIVGADPIRFSGDRPDQG
jgi:DUF4097 and DUF4098 domain-containing protein YvlB